MDGETDLKTRVIPKPCAGLTSAQLLDLKVRGFVPAAHYFIFRCVTEVGFGNYYGCCIQYWKCNAT